MSEAVIIALFSATGVFLGYVIRAVELAARNTTTVQRNAILGFSDLCNQLTSRLATIEAQLAEAQRRITELEDQITQLQIENASLQHRLDSPAAH
jgi:uncharacterized protein HemX